MTPEMFAEHREPASGPAFIPALMRCGREKDCENCRVEEHVPPGYLWHPATESTAAGWVRPHGGTP